MDSAKTQLADRLKSANNILVTVSRDPSIDQLAACLGLTLLLNKMNKHSVAVFSGQVPSTIEFLKPDATLEKTTDSLRDFIISLDKDKADKLRYKVEDNVVRIFITPYKTSITEEDLEFSQGDFNVDVVVALGVKQQQDLDEAITAHGRILHDATVASITLAADGGLGTINWRDPEASSLSELVTDLSQLLGDNLLDNQIATALLTGIVAETDRFSNNKTSSQTMNASSALMAAGANQQLVATKLEEPEPEPAPEPEASREDGEEKPADATKKRDPSTLTIAHEPEDSKPAAEQPELPPPAGQSLPTPPPPADLPPPELPDSQPPAGLQPGAKLLTDNPPDLGGTLNANTKPEGFDPVTDPLSMPQKEAGQLLDHPTPPQVPPAPQTTAPPPLPEPAPTPPPESAPTPPPLPTPISTPPQEPAPPETLSQIEQSVHSPHVSAANTAHASQLDSARDEVSQALSESVTPTPPPIKALNAQPLGEELHPDSDRSEEPKTAPIVEPPSSSVLPFDNAPESSDTDPAPKPPDENLSPSPQVDDSTKAPPVPPPFTPGVLNNNRSDQSPPL
jgi:hypothetical protein